MKRLTHLLTIVLVVALGGCTNMTGPSAMHPLTSEELRAELGRMRAEPVELERPIVVIDGWLPIGGGPVIERELQALTGADEDQFVRRTYGPIFSSLESNATKVIEMIEERWPSDDPEWTVEVDAIGYSMGGLVGRLAAMPPPEKGKRTKRLRMKRFFTIAAPHRGDGWWLGWAMIDQMSWAASIYAGGYRATLDEALADADYELICYGQGNDWVVGANYAPPGHTAIVARGQFLLSHCTSYGNYRHLGDIAARLRGEEPHVVMPEPEPEPEAEPEADAEPAPEAPSG